MSPRLRALLLATFALCLPACANQTPPTTVEGDWPLIFTRSGGFAGLDQQLIVHADGRAIWRDGAEQQELQVAQNTLISLQALLEAAPFEDLPRTSAAPPGSADLFSYSITYAGRTIEFQDEAVPAGVEPVLRLINEIAARRDQ